MTQHSDVVIIGAGLSGIMAARALSEAGKSVVLLDKSRSVGGRLATRRVGDGQADTGAQFFTVRDAEFSGYVERWLAEGVVFEWSRGWSDGSLMESRDGHPRYAARGGMNALAHHLAQGLDARVNVEAASVTRVEQGWQVEDTAGERRTGAALVMTPPLPQTFNLLRRGGTMLPEDAQSMLSAVEYLPCITIILPVDDEVGLPAPGAMQRPHANLHWIADNLRKGISRSRLLTLQASESYSRVLWDLTDAEILRKIRVDLEPLVDEAALRMGEAQVKRWRYSRPEAPLADEYLLTQVSASGLDPAHALFCGDAFYGARVEGAFISGLRGGRALAAAL
jgi:renalase